jgi:hypothetical protein
MDLVAVEFPALGITPSRKATKLSDVFLSGRLRSEILEVKPDELIQAHPLAFSDLLSLFSESLVKS